MLAQAFHTKRAACFIHYFIEQSPQFKNKAFIVPITKVCNLVLLEVRF